jgi:hypothetical protein
MHVVMRSCALCSERTRRRQLAYPPLDGRVGERVGDGAGARGVAEALALDGEGVCRLLSGGEGVLADVPDDRARREVILLDARVRRERERRERQERGRT